MKAVKQRGARVKKRRPKGPISPKPQPMFGPFITMLREGSGLSRDDFAKQAGVAVDNLSKWENDRTLPKKREQWERMLAMHRPPLDMVKCLRIPSEDQRIKDLEERLRALEEKLGSTARKDVAGGFH